MGTAAAGLIAMVGLALVITAATLPGRQTAGVVNAVGGATSQIELGSLGV